MVKTKKAPSRVMIFINEDMWSITTLSLNKVTRSIAKVSLIVITEVIKRINWEILKTSLELSFLKTPKTNKNIIESAINISGNIKLKFSILFNNQISIIHIN